MGFQWLFYLTVSLEIQTVTAFTNNTHLICPCFPAFSGSAYFAHDLVNKQKLFSPLPLQGVASLSTLIKNDDFRGEVDFLTSGGTTFVELCSIHFFVELLASNTFVELLASKLLLSFWHQMFG